MTDAPLTFARALRRLRAAFTRSKPCAREEAIRAVQRARERGDKRGEGEAIRRAREATHAVLRAR